MADITDPQIILFSNIYMRPIAEHIRNLGLLMDDAAVEYTTIISPLLAPFAAGDVLIDGRASEGVTPVTKQDIEGLITQVGSVRNEVNAAGAAALRAKFTVTPPSL